MAARNLIVFIDTNIFLDFYKPCFESGLSILKHVDKGRDRIIVTPQVEMEFKKNRQKVILESLQLVKADWRGLGALPTVLVESKQAKAIAKSRARLDKLAATFKARLGKVLQNPTSDPVYRSAERLFQGSSRLNLRSTGRADAIRRLASRRFLEGRPPRKAGDTSIGDAINWEWIIHCAKETSSDVVIVSRDMDYGGRIDNERIVNDWLAKEFRERVGSRARLSLTDRLTDGMRAAGLTVTKAQADQEEKVLETRGTLTPPAGDISRALDRIASGYAPSAQAIDAFLRSNAGHLENIVALGGNLPRPSDIYNVNVSQAVDAIVKERAASMEHLREVLDNLAAQFQGYGLGTRATGSKPEKE
jgi:hypothetical protein